MSALAGCLKVSAMPVGSPPRGHGCAGRHPAAGVTHRRGGSSLGPCSRSRRPVRHLAHGLRIDERRVDRENADALEANKMSENDFFHSAEITSYLGPIVANGVASDYSLYQTR